LRYITSFNVLCSKNTTDKKVVYSLYFYDMLQPTCFTIIRKEYSAHERETFQDEASPLQMLNTVIILKLLFQKVQYN